ncbi:hypothetical protein BGW38_002847 [Lunasporangiospora selenospora]|uniref:Uncharacterized protein n=1 Tax=Lunasporangiospora selenospora TaxID=979761 RepID=A0A9P6G323_9FUNG|nr:hypothetical protein BGW38_002847 [Lunasporangiospora selenospora]
MTTSPYPGTPNQKNVAEEAKGINQDQEDTNHSMVVAVPRSPSLLVNSGGTNVISSALEVAESGESPLDGGDRRKKRVGKRTTGSRPQRDTRKAKPAEESQRKEREVPTNSSHIDHGVDSKESINTSSGNDGVGKLQSKLSNVSLQDRPSGYEPSVKGKRRGNTQHDATTKSSASRAPPLLKGDNFPPLPTASSTSPAPVETHNPSEIVDTPLSQEVHQNYSLPSGPGNNVASQKQGSDQLGERHVQREGGILGGMVASVSQSIPVMNTESSKTSTAAAPGTKQMTSNGEYDRAMQSGKTSGATSVSSGLSYASALKVQQ